MELKLENVEKVYSGHRNKCMCGCAGKWSYAGEEDRSVKIIFNKVKRAEGQRVEENCVFITTETRILAVYLKA